MGFNWASKWLKSKWIIFVSMESVLVVQQQRTEKQTGNVFSVRNWVCEEHSIEAIKENVTFGRNKHTREKSQTYLCYKLHFLILKYFNNFILHKLQEK